MIARSHIIARTFSILLIALGFLEQTSLADTESESESVQIDGEKVFGQACFSCHGTGFYGAPLIGDQQDWTERLTRGETELIAHTLQGMNSMPARGGCMQCSDAEIQAAVRYLINY